MKIQHIRISNILGINELEFSPGGWNAITGPNGAGKTSILEAIKASVQGGQDATLLRKGAEKGEIVLLLDDGTEITKRVTPARTVTDVAKDGKKITRPAEAIKALTDTLSVNPVEFLNAAPKDRVRVLLESMPIVINPDQVEAISGMRPPATGDGLAILDGIHKSIYDDRTGTNRAVREKESTINQLEAALPAAPAGVDGSEQDIAATLEGVDAAKATELNRIDVKMTTVKDGHAERCAKLREAAQAEIDQIKARLETQLKAEDEELARVSGLAHKGREKAITLHAEQSAPLRAALATIRANADQAARRAQTVQVIHQMRADLEALKADAIKQTAALDAIEAYKRDLLAALPIPGLTIENGEVALDGIPFDRLNTAKQVSIAFQIAKLRAGDLAVCCLDGLELLDSDRLAELEAQAKASGMQVFVTRVSDEQFAVKSK